MPVLPCLNGGLVKPHACDLGVQVRSEAGYKFLIAPGVGDKNIFGHAVANQLTPEQ